MVSKADVDKLKKQIESLPKGYISRKKINGKERFYLQWREGGTVKSRYIKSGEVEELSKLISERKALETELRELENGNSKYMIDGASQTSTAAVPFLYLKWENHVIGEIDKEYNVRFTKPEYNQVVRMYTKGQNFWTRNEFLSFLSERIINRDRRDIEEILFRLGLSDYDTIAIAIKTKAINAKDMIWIAKHKNDKMTDAVSDVFDSVFFQKKDLQGDSVDTPEGFNIKRYGVYRGNYGIYKERISPLSTDVESEVAVYKLAKLLGVPCCPCYRVNQDTVFSSFQYDFTKEHIVHFRRLVGDNRKENELLNLVAARPQYLPSFAKMIALDFITRQDDRHLSNIAIKVSDTGESFYPPYDNGRSLFYEDTEETVRNAVADVKKYSTTFGQAGTYWDHICDLCNMGIDFNRLLNLNIKKKDVEQILTAAKFTGYRFDGAVTWIMKCIDAIQGR